MLWSTGRMQQEWKTDPHPTSGEKAMVPSTGNLLGWHRQTAVLRGTQELVSSCLLETPGLRWVMLLHAGRAQQPLSYLPGTRQGQSQLHSAKRCPKRPQDPQLIFTLGFWLGMPTALAPTRSSLVPVSPPHFLTHSPPKYATYIHPGRRLALGED